MNILIKLHSLLSFIRRIMIRFLLLISKKFLSKPVQKKLPRTYHMVVERCHPGVLQIIYLFLRIIWFMQIMHVMILWIVTWVEKKVPNFFGVKLCPSYYCKHWSRQQQPKKKKKFNFPFLQRECITLFLYLYNLKQ